MGVCKLFTQLIMINFVKFIMIKFVKSKKYINSKKKLYTRKNYRENQRLRNVIAQYEVTFSDDYLTQCAHYVYY
jgi:hypothetical protein